MTRKVDLEMIKAVHKSAEQIYAENDGKVGAGMTGQLLDALDWAVQEIEQLRLEADMKANEEDFN